MIAHACSSSLLTGLGRTDPKLMRISIYANAVTSKSSRQQTTVKLSATCQSCSWRKWQNIVVNLKSVAGVAQIFNNNQFCFHGSSFLFFDTSANSVCWNNIPCRIDGCLMPPDSIQKCTRRSSATRRLWYVGQYWRRMQPTLKRGRKDTIFMRSPSCSATRSLAGGGKTHRPKHFFFLPLCANSWWVA